jgi:chromosome segregation protein
LNNNSISETSLSECLLPSVSFEQVACNDTALHSMDAIKNLTDSDKLFRDEYKIIKLELDEKTTTLARMQIELQHNFSSMNEFKKLYEIKETQLNESIKREVTLSENLNETNEKCISLSKQVEEFERQVKQLRNEIDVRANVEKDMRADSQRLGEKIIDINLQLQDKLSEIEFLNRENNALQERINSDEKKLRSANDEINKMKQSLDRLSNEYTEMSHLLKNKDATTKNKLEEFEKTRQDLSSLQKKYSELTQNLDSKVTSLTSEIDRLKKDKEKLSEDLLNLKNKQRLTSGNFLNFKFILLINK